MNEEVRTGISFCKKGEEHISIAFLHITEPNLKKAMGPHAIEMLEGLMSDIWGGHLVLYLEQRSGEEVLTTVRLSKIKM